VAVTRQSERLDQVHRHSGADREAAATRPRGRPKKTWTGVVQKDCQACKLNREDAMDRSRWRT